MKNMKRLVTLLFAVIMVMAMSVTALGADTFTITLTEGTNTDGNASGPTTNHEYKVYQLFTGELTITGTGTAEKKTLSNVRYGTAGLGTTGELVADTVLAAITDAESYADSLTISKLTAYGTLNASNTYSLSNVPAGYYLIVDDTTKTLTEGDSYSKYIVQVVDDISMAPKSEKVTSTKTEWDDAVAQTSLNEAGIGSVVSYEITGTVAKDAASYNNYYFIMADTLSTGLTFNDDVKLYTRTTTKNDEDEDVVTDTLLETSKYAVYTGTDAKEGTTQYTFEVALKNAKTYAGQTIVAKYSATVNSNVEIMKAELNKYKLIYSNDPEHSYTEDTTHPGKPISTDMSVMGETAETTTETYATKLTLTKQDQDGNLLKGATFRLTSTDANQTVVKNGSYFQLNNNVADADAWYLLKNGTYTQTAPTGAAYTYTKIGKGDSKTEVGYIKSGDDYIVPSNTADYIDQDLYMKVGTADSKYASFDKYEKVTLTGDTSSVASPVNIVLTTGDDGVITFNGLGTGTYTLEEVDAPDGFNYVGDVTFTITFNTETKKFEVSDSDVTGGTISNDVDADGNAVGTFNTTITDKSGSVLPSTGGIGTTLFYVIGGILVVGAGVLLVAKKRVAR